MPGRNLARTVALGAAAIAALAGCGDIVIAARWSGGLSFEPAQLRLDFGEVEVGREKTKIFRIRNDGQKPISLGLAPPPPPWSWDLPEGLERLVVPAQNGDEPSLVEIRFRFAPASGQVVPRDAGARLVDAVAGVTYVVALEGAAIESPIRCSPGAISFGTVVTGEERVEVLRCENLGSDPLAIEVPAPQFAGDPGATGGSRFVVDRARERVEIGGHERLDLRVRFQAGEENPGVHAFLPLRRADTSALIFPGEGLELSGQPVPPFAVQLGDPATDPSLDFGFVPLGGVRELSLQLRSLYDRRVSLEAVVEGGLDGEFEAYAPDDLDPFPDLDLLRVRFTPREPGPKVAQVRVRVRRPDSTRVATTVIPLRGFGGGPEVACDPWAFDFGQVAVGAMSRAHVECWNAGDDLPTGDDDLEVVGVQVVGAEQSGGIFGARLVPGGFGTFRVEVDYRPVAAGLDIDQLAIRTCTGSGCAGDPGREERNTYVDLAGTGRHVAPEAYCDAVLEPASLDFGRPSPGAVARLSTRLVNRGTHDCFLSRLDVSPGGGAGFRVDEAPEASWVLPAGASRELFVEYRPDEVPGSGARPAAAVAGFWLSNPSRPRLELALAGLAGPSCLRLDPPSLDFTALPERTVATDLACGAPDLRVKVWNECTGVDRTVTAIAPAVGSDPAFRAAAPGPLPAYLSPGTAHEFAVDFRPALAGTHHGGLRVEVDGAVGPEALFLPVTGRAEEEGRWFDRFPLARPRLDLLIVLASSPAMWGRPVASALASPLGISRLVDNLDRPDLDWQVGITSSDLAAPFAWSCEDGGRNGGEAGRLVPASGGRARLLSPTRTSFAADFAANVAAVRACNVAERSFDAALLAATPPLVTSASDPRFPNGLGNLGLVRPGAHLALVFVSAGDDNASVAAPADVHAALQAGRSPGLFSAWAIVGAPGVGCSFPGGGTAAPGDRYQQVANLTQPTGTVTRSVCDPDAWGWLWYEVGSRAARAGSTHVLEAPPSREAGATEVVHVRPDGRVTVVPENTGWGWEPTRPAIVMKADWMQSYVEQGGTIEVRYRLACD